MKKNRFVSKLLLILSIISFGLVAFYLVKNGILPIRYRKIFIIAGLAIYILATIIILARKSPKLLRGIAIVFITLLMLVFVFTFVFINKGLITLDKLNRNANDKVYMDFSIVVMKDSDYKSIEDIGEDYVYAAINTDNKNFKLFKEQFSKDNKIDINYADGKSYVSMAEDLLDGRSKIILLNENYRTSIEDNRHEFSRKTKVIYSAKIEKKIHKDDLVKQKPVGENTPFNLYISGADTYSNNYSHARSDVNLLMTINPKTNQILITTIPRDSYIRIAGKGDNKKDKFTHSGIYGASSSIMSLENLFGIDINYYAKVNFNSLINVVDALGGIEVDNAETFTSVLNKKTYKKGRIHLNGEDALAFARERKHLTEGDLGRGKNHIRIVEGMINKAMSPAILLKYSKVLDVLSDSMETNMPNNKIIDMINAQLDSNKDWKIESIDLEGKGKMGLPSYAMPGYKLWFLVPDKSSIENVSNKINSLLEAE